MEGRIQSAVDCFNQSLLSFPTAEGYTYRGWAVSFLGMLEQAVEDCRRAIRVDPEFGNPYNDIGVYMMQLGLLDEAIPWLEQAKRAKRYEPKHFPYLNLGHVYRAKGDQGRALEEYMKALEFDPDNAHTRAALTHKPVQSDFEGRLYRGGSLRIMAQIGG